MRKSSKNRGKPLPERLAELERSGQSGPAIHRALLADGYDVSPRSVGRMLHKLRGSQRVARRLATRPAEPTSPPPPEQALPSEDEIASTADLATLDEWLMLAGRAARAAEARGDAATLARFGQLATSILEAKRRATPEEKPDGVFVTSDEMEKLAEAGRKRFERLLAGMLKEAQDTWPRCPACGQCVAPKELQ